MWKRSSELHFRNFRGRSGGVANCAFWWAQVFGLSAVCGLKGCGWDRRVNSKVLFKVEIH